MHQAPAVSSFNEWDPLEEVIAFNSFGGSFHCATLDVRWRGTLRSYF